MGQKRTLQKKQRRRPRTRILNLVVQRQENAVLWMIRQNIPQQYPRKECPPATSMQHQKMWQLHSIINQSRNLDAAAFLALSRGMLMLLRKPKYARRAIRDAKKTTSVLLPAAGPLGPEILLRLLL